jgi:hypothetical protein
MGTKSKKRLLKLRLVEEMEAVMFCRATADIKKGELFQLVDKAFL